MQGMLRTSTEGGVGLLEAKLLFNSGCFLIPRPPIQSCWKPGDEVITNVQFQNISCWQLSIVSCIQWNSSIIVYCGHLGELVK